MSCRLPVCQRPNTAGRGNDAPPRRNRNLPSPGGTPEISRWRKPPGTSHQRRSRHGGAAEGPITQERPNFHPSDSEGPAVPVPPIQNVRRNSKRQTQAIQNVRRIAESSVAKVSPAILGQRRFLPPVLFPVMTNCGRGQAKHPGMPAPGGSFFLYFGNVSGWFPVDKHVQER